MEEKMKKIFACFALFTLFFAVSCDDGIKFNNPNDKHNQTAQSDDEGQLGGECYPNKTCNKGLSCDKENNICIEESENTNDDEKTDTVSTNDDEPVSDDSDSGYTMPDDGDSTDDSGDSVPDESDSDDDYPDDGDTTPDEGDSTTDKSDTTPDDDTDTVQTNPCDPNPCLDVANSTKECIETGDTTYSCKCNSGFNWTGSLCQSNSTPSLPECSTSTTTFPCKDSTTPYIWSERYNQMKWQAAVDKCASLNAGNYGGYSSGWHLPTISELRTLIKNCSRNIMPGGTCKVREDEELVCLTDSCWTSETCGSCDYDETGLYSKFGETGWFWSSSAWPAYTYFPWYVDFDNGYVYYSRKANNDVSYVRCVR